MAAALLLDRRLEGVGKIVEVGLDAADEAQAKAKAEEMAEKLLANPVIESFEVTVGGRAV